MELYLIKIGNLYLKDCEEETFTRTVNEAKIYESKKRAENFIQSIGVGEIIEFEMKEEKNQTVDLDKYHFIKVKKEHYSECEWNAIQNNIGVFTNAFDIKFNKIYLD